MFVEATRTSAVAAAGSAVIGLSRATAARTKTTQNKVPPVIMRSFWCLRFGSAIPTAFKDGAIRTSGGVVLSVATVSAGRLEGDDGAGRFVISTLLVADDPK